MHKVSVIFPYKRFVRLNGLVYNEKKILNRVQKEKNKMSRKTIEKFKKQPEANPAEILEMELIEFQYPKSGTGICPECGGKMNGVGLDWECEGCDLKLVGPIF